MFINAFSINKSLNIDPELILINYYNSLEKSKEFLCLPDELRVMDIGRNWIRENKFIKWNRTKTSDTEIIEYSTI